MLRKEANFFYFHMFIKEAKKIHAQKRVIFSKFWKEAILSDVYYIFLAVNHICFPKNN